MTRNEQLAEYLDDHKYRCPRCLDDNTVEIDSRDVAKGFAKIECPVCELPLEFSVTEDEIELTTTWSREE